MTTVFENVPHAAAAGARLIEVKRQARVTAAQRRAFAHARHGARAARALANHGLDGLHHQIAALGGGVASGYCAMGSEMDPMPLLRRLAGDGFQLALPVVERRCAPLVFRAWSVAGPTIAAGFGTREPPPHHSLVSPDLLIVPLLAFDATGARLGYGGGFYDRTIAQARQTRRVLTVGVAYDEQELAAVPCDDRDQRLDWIVTPSGCRPGLAGTA